jgi:hypothetical protein
MGSRKVRLGELGGVGEIGPKEGEIIRLLPNSGSGMSVVSLHGEIFRGVITVVRYPFSVGIGFLLRTDD